MKKISWSNKTLMHINEDTQSILIFECFILGVASIWWWMLLTHPLHCHLITITVVCFLRLMYIYLQFIFYTIAAQVNEKSKLRVREALDKDKPRHMSLALDGWSQHHHGYIGAITSKYTCLPSKRLIYFDLV